MPYIGTKHRYDDRLITVKLYGPKNDFAITIDTIKNLINRAVSDIDGEHSILAHYVARFIADETEELDNHVLWVECEVMYPDGSLYSGIVELETVG